MLMGLNGFRPICSAMNKKPIVLKIVVGGIVFNNGKVLIIQRSSSEATYPNLWELPSGKKEPLEKVSDAILREVKEETGLNVQIRSVCNVIDYVIEKESEIRDATQINFILDIIGQNIIALSPEHQKHAWITLSEIGNYNLSKKIKETMTTAFNN